MVMSKQKGSTAERFFADKLSKWWQAEFLRIPNSGALRWGGSTFTYGDLLVPVDFPCIVESKHHKSFSLLKTLTCKPSKDNILGWYLQVCEDVRRCKAETGQTRFPMLVAKGNRTTPIIGVDNKLALELPTMPALFVVNPAVPPFYIMALDVFLEAVSPDMIRLAAAKLGASNGASVH